MSKEYRINGENINMREWCKRPGKRDENNNIVYLTQQHQKEQVDINNVIRRYKKGEVITRVSNFEAKFGDVTGIDFQESMNLIINAQRSFDELPSRVRKRFNNSPEMLLEFMEDPGNRDEAIELGLINKDWTPETDGLGEHVPQGGNIDGSQLPDPKGKDKKKVDKDNEE